MLNSIRQKSGPIFTVKRKNNPLNFYLSQFPVPVSSGTLNILFMQLKSLFYHEKFPIKYFDNNVLYIFLVIVDYSLNLGLHILKLFHM